MIKTFASDKLKQPIFLNIPEAEWERLKKISDKDELNYRLLQLAHIQIMKHGYEAGTCNYRNKKVTLRDCIGCGLSRGQKTKTEWENCVKENIRFNFNMQKPINLVKDEKILEKLKPTKTEAAKHHNIYTSEEKLNEKNYHDKEELDLIEKTRKNVEGEWFDADKK